LAAAETLRCTIGVALPPASHDDDGRLHAALQSTLGDADFAAAWAAGESMPLDAAVETALAITRPGNG
jgi:hypothetical protein